MQLGIIKHHKNTTICCREYPKRLTHSTQLRLFLHLKFVLAKHWDSCVERAFAEKNLKTINKNTFIINIITFNKNHSFELNLKTFICTFQKYVDLVLNNFNILICNSWSRKKMVWILLRFWNNIGKNNFRNQILKDDLILKFAHFMFSFFSAQILFSKYEIPIDSRDYPFPNAKHFLAKEIGNVD